MKHIGLGNVHYHCIYDIPKRPYCDGESIKCPQSRYSWYKDYIEEPSKWGVKFDVVLVDGRARPQCAVFIRDYLRDENSIGMYYIY